jgi:hypothetical protein
MAWVTKDQIGRARQIDVLDYVLKYEADTVKRIGSSYRRKDHPSIEISNGKWRWYSQGLYGKTALDYLTDVQGYAFVDAVCLLLGERPQERSNRSELTLPMRNEKPPPERLPLSLPVRNKDNNRVIAYLQSREIDRDLILDCINRGVLYESKYYHNAMFLGKDENGRTRFAAMRSTTDSFMRDADGSVKKYGFMLPPANPDSVSVAVYESPIDALSHQTLCKQGYIPPFDGWRLSLGGISAAAMEHFLERHPHIAHCLVCTDADEAGERTAVTIADIPGLTVERCLPLIGTDWNDTLRDIKRAERNLHKSQRNQTLTLS